MNQFQSFAEVMSALRRRLWLILVVTCLGSLLSLYLALNQAKVYEATAVVQIEDARVPDQLTGSTTTQSDSARRVQLIEQRLMARDNLVRIMDKHSLFNDDPAVAINERVFLMRQAARIEEIIASASPFAPGGSAPSGLMITVRLSDPAKAADVANELMYSVIDQSRDRSAGSVREALDFFQEEQVRVGAQIEALDAEISAFKQENGDLLPAGVTELRSLLVSLRDEDLLLDREIITIETSSARQREAVLSRQVELLNEQKLLIAERIAGIQQQLAAAPEVERELNRMERDLDQLQEQYTVITRRKAEAQMGQLLEDREATDRFEVLETALEPEAPVSRSRKQLAIMGGVASIIAGIVAAFAVELANPAIRTAAQMERMLGIQPVVSIPTVASQRNRGQRGLAVVLILLAALAGLWAAMRAAGLTVIDSLGQFLPRTTRG